MPRPRTSLSPERKAQIAILWAADFEGTAPSVPKSAELSITALLISYTEKPGYIGITYGVNKPVSDILKHNKLN